MNEIQPGFTNPQALPPKRQLSKTVQIIVLLGVVVMLGFLAYSYVSTGTPLPPIQLDNTATTTVQNTATTTNNIATNITEGWKTYRNEELGIQFEYPQDKEVKILDGGTISIREIGFVPPGKDCGEALGESEAYIDINSLEDVSTLNKWTGTTTITTSGKELRAIMPSNEMCGGPYGYVWIAPEKKLVWFYLSPNHLDDKTLIESFSFL